MTKKQTKTTKVTTGLVVPKLDADKLKKLHNKANTPTKPALPKKLTAKETIAKLEGDIEALKNNIGHLTIQRNALQEQLADNQITIDDLQDTVEFLKQCLDPLTKARCSSLFGLIKMYFKGEI